MRTSISMLLLPLMAEGNALLCRSALPPACQRIYNLYIHLTTQTHCYMAFEIRSETTVRAILIGEKVIQYTNRISHGCWACPSGCQYI
ncbi:hypothetical protein BC629DRAFT_1510564 [Irpex lacteus]|nr:hypothetical protein BC629DRAFT_1510564 [Irpex lacteus]